MKLNNIKYILILFMYLSFSRFLYSDENTIKRDVSDIVSYKGFGIIINTDKDRFEQIADEISNLPPKKQMEATYICFRTIYGSRKKVIDRNSKIMKLLQGLQESKLTINKKIIPYLSLCLDSDEDENICDKAIQILIEHAEVEIMFINDNSRLIMKIEAK